MGENADMVRQAWEAFGRGDLDGAVATTSDSAEIVMPETLPWGGTYRGPEGFKEMIQKFLSNFENVDPTPQQFLETDDGHVVVTVKGVGTTKSGNQLSGDSIWLYDVQGGEVTRAQFYGDTAQAVEALG